jgi:CxxC-x17-CxxC domain-containing protein
VSAANRVLACRDCGATFTFSTGEQAFFASRGLLNPPSRCPACRANRKAVCPGQTGYVSYGHAASFAGRTPRQMHPATCSHCGQATEVPFVPHEDKPVLCGDCFSAQDHQQP